MSAVGLFIMSLGFLAFMPEFLSDISGLKQRLFHIGWSVWFIYLSYSFINLQKHNNNETHKTNGNDSVRQQSGSEQ
jgi:hypothetical protein